MRHFELQNKKIKLASSDVVVPIISCIPLLENKIPHGFSTRLGGCSPLPENSLNLAFKNDLDSNVVENKIRFLSALKRKTSTIRTLKQTHSADVFDLSNGIIENQQGDALINKKGDVFLGIKTADCLPILIIDLTTHSYAAIHSGWSGTLQNISKKAVDLLVRTHQINLNTTLAALGPSACEDCYEVGGDLVDKFERAGLINSQTFKRAQGKKHHMNNKAAVKNQLIAAGLLEKNIFISEFCTMHQNDLFFSHRKEGLGPVGRLLSVIAAH